MSDVAAINNVLSQIRAIRSQIESAPAAQEAMSTAPSRLDFSKTFKSAVDMVNDSQMTSADLKTRFEKGDPNVTLADVMLASQKAGLAFEAAVQVRNRMIQAYQDIMNMPI